MFELPLITMPERDGSRRVAAIGASDIWQDENMPGAIDVDEYEEDDPLFTVIAFDPGGRTGWGIFCIHPDAMVEEDLSILENIVFWSAGEFAGREDEMVDAMLGLVEAWPDRSDIVVEDFIPQLGAPIMDREVLSPIRVTAAFCYGLRDTGWGRGRGRGVGRVPIMQMPSTAMATITDDRLRALGFWNPLTGQPHARDAVRHALTWLRRKKDIGLKLARAAARRKR